MTSLIFKGCFECEGCLSSSAPKRAAFCPNSVDLHFVFSLRVFWLVLSKSCSLSVFCFKAALHVITSTIIYIYRLLPYFIFQAASPKVRLIKANVVTRGTRVRHGGYNLERWRHERRNLILNHPAYPDVVMGTRCRREPTAVWVWGNYPANLATPPSEQMGGLCI